MPAPNEYKVIRPGTDPEGKVSRVAMIVTLVNSGVPLESIALAQDLTDAERQQIEKEVTV